MKNKSFALITGASSGLGIHLAHECALRGYPLILVALPGTGLDQVAIKLRLQTGVQVHFIEVDLADESGPDRVFDYCLSLQLQVGILINNAGIGLESSFATIPVSYCNTLLQLNTIAVVKLTSLFLPTLKTLPSSYILNVSSLASYAPMPFKGIYSASKTFINSFSRSLHTELKGTGVTISVLCPGAIPTNEIVRNRIKNHGWFAKAGVVEPGALAVIAIRGLFNKQQVIIPGWINRVSRFMMAITPMWLQQEILYRSYVNKQAAIPA